MAADQRNGVIVGHALGLGMANTAAVNRGGAAGFTATFEIVAADKAGGWSAEKRRPLCAEDIAIAAPRTPFATLAALSPLATRTCQGAKGPGNGGHPCVDRLTIAKTHHCVVRSRRWSATVRHQGRGRHRAGRGQPRPSQGERSSRRFWTGELVITADDTCLPNQHPRPSDVPPLASQSCSQTGRVRRGCHRRRCSSTTSSSMQSPQSTFGLLGGRCRSLPRSTLSKIVVTFGGDDMPTTRRPGADTGSRSRTVADQRV